MERHDAERWLDRARQATGTDPVARALMNQLANERDSLMEAVRCLAAEGDTESALELTVAVWRLWLASGDVEGGRRLLAPVLSAAATPSALLARALYADGLLAFRQGNQSQSKARNEAALVAARAASDCEAESLALVGLSRIALRDGDYARVRELARQARQLVRGQDPAADAAPLHLLAAGTRLGGDYDTARELYLESLDLSRRLESGRMVVTELHNLGHVELHRGDTAAATRFFAECAERRSASENPYDLAMELLNRAALTISRPDDAAASELLDRATQILSNAGIALDPDDQYELDGLRTQLQSRAQR